MNWVRISSIVSVLSDIGKKTFFCHVPFLILVYYLTRICVPDIKEHKNGDVIGYIMIHNFS